MSLLSYRRFIYSSLFFLILFFYLSPYRPFFFNKKFLPQEVAPPESLELTKLIHAATSGNTIKVEALLKQAIAVDTRDQQGAILH